MKSRLAILLPLFAALAPSAQAFQDKPKPVAAHPKVDQEKVDEAIKNGCVVIIGGGVGMFPHGQRNQPQAQQGYAELTLLTLLHSGYYFEGDPAIQGLVDYVLQKPLGSTYTASLMAMALQKLNAKKYQERIALCAQFLCDNQCENGQWDYGEPVSLMPGVNYDLPKRKKADDVATGGGDPNGSGTPPPAPGASGTPASTAGKTVADGGKKPGKTTSIPKIPVRKRKPGPPNGDNSNSQYAALGLRACLDANIDVDPAVLDKARKWWIHSQNSDGGWGYNDHGNQGGGANPDSVSNDSYGSMTVGATGALCIYDYFMGIAYKTDPNVLKGLDWLGKNFDVTKNPGKNHFAYLYYLYGLERVGMLYGTEKIGASEWYPVGANHLLATQTPGGGWNGNDKLPGQTQTDTCFAILFLRRGTMPLKPPQAVATGGRENPAGAPVPNGAPVANGGNRDAGLVANKAVEAVAAGWRLTNCRAEMQKVKAIGGKEGVLMTVTEALNSPPTFRRVVDVPSSPGPLQATVGHEPNGGWTLIVKIDTKEVLSKPISSETSKDGWVDVSVDLTPFAGKQVIIELIGVGEAPIWANVGIK